MIPAAGAGEVMVIVPVGVVHVGWVSVAVGAAGVKGAALIVQLAAAETHPEAFFTVTL